MRLRNSILLFLVLYAICTSAARAQDSSLYFKLHSLPDEFFRRISANSKDVERKLTRQRTVAVGFFELPANPKIAANSIPNWLRIELK